MAPMGRTARRVQRRVQALLFGTARVPRLGGFTLRVHRRGDDVMAPALLRSGVWEPQETELLLALLRPGMVFVDAGANIGYYSVLASRLVGPGGRVRAFEPAPDSFRLLQMNLADNGCGNAVAHRAALWDRHGGELTLYLCDRNPGDHRTAAPAEAARRTARVPATTLDAALGGRVDVIKMDTQGAEARIWGGMRRTLERSPGLLMLAEFWPHGLRRAGSDPAAFLGALRAAGFQPELVLDEASGRPAAAAPWSEPVAWEAILPLCGGERFVNLLLRRAAGAAPGPPR